MDRLGRDGPGPDGPWTAASNLQDQVDSVPASTRRRGSEEVTPEDGSRCAADHRSFRGPRVRSTLPGNAAMASPAALTIKYTLAGRSFDPARVMGRTIVALTIKRTFVGRSLDPARVQGRKIVALTITRTLAGRSFDPARVLGRRAWIGADPGRQPLDQVK